MFNKYISLCRRPDATAIIRGNENYPKIKGTVRFCESGNGIIVIAEITGLPANKELCKNSVLGFHIHEGTACSGTPSDAFADTKAHLNPKNCQHPHHDGDMPPLFVTNNGYAFLAFVSDRITLNEIIEKTVVIHSAADDFKTQPSGNSGFKIACGTIKKS